MRVKQVWVWLLVIVAFAIIVTLEIKAPTQKDTDTKLWNNGFCVCGEKWEYDRTVRYIQGDVYYFKCKKCNDIIALETKVFVNR